MSFKASNSVEQAVIPANTPVKVKVGVEELAAPYASIDHSPGNDHDIIVSEDGEYRVYVGVKDYERANSKTLLRLLVNDVEQEAIKQDSDGDYNLSSTFPLAADDRISVEYTHNGSLNQALRVGCHIRVDKS